MNILINLKLAQLECARLYCLAIGEDRWAEFWSTVRRELEAMR